jgi:5-formyltetrahydrofolate cyclo-ligase
LIIPPQRAAPRLKRVEPEQRPEVRRRLLRARERLWLDAPERAEANNQRVMQRLDALIVAALQCQPGLRVALYWPIRGEPDWRFLASRWRNHGARLLLPVVVQRGAALQFRHFDTNTCLSTDRWGIAFPRRGPWWGPELVVAPCVGFDPGGWRLGYGGGFYDRTLATLQVPSVGVGFDSQRISIAPSHHDVQLTAIVTQSRITWPRSGRVLAPCTSP